MLLSLIEWGSMTKRLRPASVGGNLSEDMSNIKVEANIESFSRWSCQGVVKLTIDLGHKLAVSAVAKGIETKAIWRLLSNLGQGEVQGYLHLPADSRQRRFEWRS